MTTIIIHECDKCGIKKDHLMTLVDCHDKDKSVDLCEVCYENFHHWLAQDVIRREPKYIPEYMNHRGSWLHQACTDIACEEHWEKPLNIELTEKGKNETNNMPSLQDEDEEGRQNI